MRQACFFDRTDVKIRYVANHFFNKKESLFLKQKLNLVFMITNQIESIFFRNRTKDQLIEETLASLSGLLADIFTGEDLNNLKKELPEGINIEDIGIELKAACIYLNSKEFSIPSCEIAIDLIQEKTQYEIGTYSLIFNENGEQLDEILTIN